MIGIPDEKWDERPLALVVLKSDFKGKVTPEEIKGHFQKFIDDKVISKWAVPDRIEFVDQIPKTSVGKIDKKEIRKQYIKQ